MTVFLCLINIFLPIAAVYHDLEHTSNVTVEIIFNQQYKYMTKMANVFDNNITNSVVLPFSTQIQSNISQKFHRYTIHLNQ